MTRSCFDYSRLISFVFLGGMAAATAVTACQKRDFGDANVQEMTTVRLRGDEFGITGRSGEIALTFDDGPGDCTLEMAKFLASEEVPATFFVTLQGRPEREAEVTAILQELGQLKLSNGQYAFNIGNHTYSHTMKPKGGGAATTNAASAPDIARLDALITSLNKTGEFFFRAPGGEFTTDPLQVVALNKITSLKKYIGPVSWNIGGDLEFEPDKTTIKFGADWACWSRIGRDWNSIETCMKGYLNEIAYKQKLKYGGIILMHDDGNKVTQSGHAQTWEMLMGPLDYANCKALNPEKGLIRRAKKAGYKFVSLQAHPEKIAELKRLVQVAP